MVVGKNKNLKKKKGSKKAVDVFLRKEYDYVFYSLPLLTNARLLSFRDQLMALVDNLNSPELRTKIKT